MKLDDLKTICVIGAGNMGHQIALLCAINGFKTVCTDVSGEMLDKARAFAESYLPERVAKGRLTEEQAGEAKKNISFTSSLTEAAREADLVIEAVIENLEIKRELFAKLDAICPPHTILATNSSFIVSSKIADATKRPEKVCNMHFFNPALVMKLVEVVQGPHTSVETAQIVFELSKKMGKVPVWLKKEIYGFIANRLLAAIKKEALFILESGVATHEEIDLAAENALGYPMGPFRLMDLTGIDLSYHIASERYKETGDPTDKPAKIIEEKYLAKEWGRKTKVGFYSYE